MKKFLLIFILFIVINVNALSKEVVSFDKCVDGDTAWLIKDNESLKYRFLAIDTKETVHPTKDGGIFGKTASDFTCNSLMNAKVIEIEYDQKSSKKDKYNRELVWIYLDGKLFQETLIEKGYATVDYIYGDYKYVESLKEKESIAKSNKIGIWQNIYIVKFIYKDNKKEVEVIEGSKVEPIELPKKYQSDFIGWYYDESEFDFDTIINEDIELNAKYDNVTSTLRIIFIVLILVFLFYFDKKKFNKLLKKLT